MEKAKKTHKKTIYCSGSYSNELTSQPRGTSGSATTFLTEPSLNGEINRSGWTLSAYCCCNCSCCGNAWEWGQLKNIYYRHRLRTFHRLRMFLNTLRNKIPECRWILRRLESLLIMSVFNSKIYIGLHNLHVLKDQNFWCTL